MWLRYQNVQTGNPDMLNLDMIEEIAIVEDSEIIDHYAIAAYTQGFDEPLILFRSPSYSEVTGRFDQIGELVAARSVEVEKMRKPRRLRRIQTGRTARKRTR